MRYNIHRKLILKRSVIFLFALLSNVIIYAQSQLENFAGIVKDKDGNPIEGVLISIQESTVTSKTNENGEFTIAASGGDKLTFEFEGFEIFSKIINSYEKSFEIALSKLLFGATGQDIVPLAYSSKKKRDISEAVSIITYDDLKERKDMNIMNGLGGLGNGLIVMSNPWSDLGSNPSFYVRGLKTTNPNNAPLVLVDDVERDFGQLNANEITSISVLKDAAALSIYGNRGANGVVLVKTKRGTDNKREIIFNTEVGLAQSLRMPKVLNAYDYARLYNQAQILDGKSPDNLTYSDEDLQAYKDVVDGVSGANPYKYPNVDFYSEFLKSVVKQQQHDLTMRGGNKVAKYFVLLGYMNREGLYKYGDNTFDRYNFRTNIDVTLTNSFTVGLDMAGRLENQTTPGGNYAYSIFGQFANTPSNAYPIFNADGSLGGTNIYKNNPYGLMNKMGQRDQSNRYFNADLIFKLDLSKFIDGLSWNAKGGIDFIDGAIKQLTSSKFAVYELLDDGTYTSNGTADEAKTKNNWYTGKDRQFTFNTSFNYDKSWGESKLTAMGLFYLRELNSLGVSVPYKTVGSVAQAGYSYMGRYLINVVVGYTGSENFARGHRFGLFPAISIGWIISEENFLKNNNTLSFLKFRASYGITGLDRPLGDRFLFRENWGSAGGYAFGTSGSYREGTDQVRIGNDNLKWETSIKSNIGLDFGFYNNSLLWTIDGFIDNRKDILVRKFATTTSVAGIPLPYENAGETKSWGFDSELAYSKQLNKSWSFAIKGNVMLAYSKIEDVNETYKVDVYQYQKGNPIWQPFGYVSNGFFTQEEIDRRSEGNLTEDEIANGYNVYQNGGNLQAGDIKYKDLNGDFVIDGKDTKPIAKNAIPNASGGITLFLQYKLIDFSAHIMGMGKRDIYMPGVYRSSFNADGNASVYALEAWTPETAETAIYPRLSINNNSNNQQYSDFWFRNGSFIKLKTVELGINLPELLVKRVGISKTRFYINGYNLLSFDHVKDYDPENPDAALNRYPFQRIYTLGLNVTF
ncbi:MAG: TonB-dependent receptor [Salinivirgaceae bacterium]|nr:TonB-dependent receptor [Salinivirgaceae bacterium]